LRSLEGDLSFGEFCIELTSARSPRTKGGDGPLAEKPKVEELQIAWLRSEDLKEEKKVTASVTSIAGEDLRHFGARDESANARKEKGRYCDPAPVISVYQYYRDVSRLETSDKASDGPERGKLVLYA
jgi:hypothetical protein